MPDATSPELRSPATPSPTSTAGTLAVPVSVTGSAGALELARLWTSDEDGETFVLNVEPLPEPGMWGMLALDLMRHAARAYEQRGTHTREQAYKEALMYFMMEMKNPSAEL